MKKVKEAMKLDYFEEYVNGVERSKQMQEQAEQAHQEDPEEENQAVFYGPVDADDGYDNNF